MYRFLSRHSNIQPQTPMLSMGPHNFALIKQVFKGLSIFNHTARVLKALFYIQLSNQRVSPQRHMGSIILIIYTTASVYTTNCVCYFHVQLMFKIINSSVEVSMLISRMLKMFIRHT